MKNPLLLNIALFTAGTVAAGIGVAGLFFPQAFHAGSGIILGDNINLLNEMRAPAGGITAMGLLILLGLVIPILTFTSIVSASVMYLAYGFSRLYSILTDGMPEGILLLATGLELFIGLLCAYTLIRFRTRLSLR